MFKGNKGDLLDRRYSLISYSLSTRYFTFIVWDIPYVVLDYLMTLPIIAFGFKSGISKKMKFYLQIKEQ